MLQKLYIGNLFYNNVIFISAFDSYDSLELAKNAHRNVVYYSSIAAEIVFLGYPVIATAPSIYSESIPDITKKTADEIEIFIKSEPPSVPIESVYPWAYYMKNGGNSNKTFEVAGPYEIYYELNRIDEPRSSINRIRNFVSLLTNKTSILNFIKNKFVPRRNHDINESISQHYHAEFQQREISRSSNR